MMTARIEGRKLIIELDLETTPRPSATGKLLFARAPTGNQATTAQVNGKPLTVGC